MSGDDEDEEDRDADDRVPFVSPESAAPAVFPMTSIARDDAGNAQRRSLRDGVEAWALRRGFVVDASVAVKEIDGVVVSVALYDVSTFLGVVRATARLPVEVSVVVEPRTRMHAFRERFAKPFRLEDPDMHRTWHVETNDHEAARALLDEACLVAIDELGGLGWCRVAYDRGRIEIQIDAGDESITGRHLTLALRVALALGRRSPRESAYR